MTKPKRSWWRPLVTALCWAVGLVAVYIATVVFAAQDGHFPIWVYVLIGVLAFNYAVNTLTEKLDNILWRLDDIERKLPDYDRYS